MKNKRKKYTYNRVKFNESGRGMSIGSGAISLRIMRENFKIYIEKYPKDLHFIIRKPDNKLMNFYHCMDGFNEVLKNDKKR